MLVGGIHEAVLDRRIVMHIDDAATIGKNTVSLSEDQKAQLLLVVVSGNLDRKIRHPQARSPETVLKAAIGIQNFPTQGNRNSSASLTRLFDIMASQYSFGSIVGAPVLFYLGSFIYGVSGLATNEGDNDTSHALAFGMWWMVIVHVAIVGRCLLATNNPSTITAIAAATIADENGRIVYAPQQNDYF